MFGRVRFIAKICDCLFEFFGFFLGGKRLTEIMDMFGIALFFDDEILFDFLGVLVLNSLLFDF